MCVCVCERESESERERERERDRKSVCLSLLPIDDEKIKHIEPCAKRHFR